MFSVRFNAFRRYVVVAIFSSCIVTCANSAWALDNSRHGKIAEKIAALKQQNVFTGEEHIFSVSTVTTNDELSELIANYTLLDISFSEKSGIVNTKPEYLRLTIPIDNGSRNFPLLLYRVDISPDGFTLLTSDGLTYPLNNIVHYRGCIDGDLNSVVSISFTEDEVSGLICNNEGNYVIGKVSGSMQNMHIIYNDRKLFPASNFQCETNTSAMKIPDLGLKNQPGTQVNSVKCVYWYWETDYDVFVGKGSVANVTSFMQAVFNQVQTLYANDGMTVYLQTLFVWTTADPYTGPSANSYLTQFGNYRKTFAGNVAHLIGYGGGGGIAWTGTLCSANPTARMAYSGINATYASVPTYSWTVDCIAHEEGHIFGSPHTHECSWNGNGTAIDGCSTPIGCPNPGLPAGGGTIMSYCHMASVGKNFSLGFGPQPTQLMLYYENNGACLPACCIAASQPGIISGNATPCSGITQVYSIAAVSGATSYSWKLPTGWTGTSTTNSITATVGSTGGSISVNAVNSCGPGTARTLAVNVSPIPSLPGAISGNTSFCPGVSQIFSVAPVAGALSYTWTMPTGWTGTSTTNSITAITATTSGTISVKANNGCGSSTTQKLTVSIATVPASPGTIAGNASVCPGSLQSYSIAAIPGVTSYSWILPTGWTGTSTTNSITSTAGTAGGSVSVKANNACGSSVARTLATTIAKPPAQPGAIAGNASVCASVAQSYSFVAVAGATSYTWTLPTGWAGTSSTNLITATSGAAGGSVSVKANNACGSSTARTLAITIAKPPAQPGAIAGNASVCASASQSYSFVAVAGSTSYTWTLPTGWTGASASNLITTTSGTAGGSISVKANNSCGSSAARTLSTTVTNVPAQPGAVAGNASVCSGSAQSYSVALVSGSTSYKWTLPSGWSGTSTTPVLASTAGSTSGTISVMANNSCGSSPARTLSVSALSKPPQPPPISGNSTGNLNSFQAYSITPVASATNYTWSLPGGWAGSSGTNSIAAVVGTTAGIISVTANNSCGSSTVRSMAFSVSASLPIQLLSFSASHSKDNVVLNWITASEVNNDYFTLEKSSDGIHFEYLGVVKGAGNSTVMNDYTFPDEHALKGISYYRLSQTDYNGHRGMSEVISVCIDREAKFEIFPNPARSIITIVCGSYSSHKVVVFDSRGRLVFTKDNINNFSQLNISFLPSGYYTIIIDYDTCSAKQVKFIKS